jgi:hypothetical protein
MLKRGVKGWNKWRAEHPHDAIDFSRENLGGTDLSGAILYDTVFVNTNLTDTRGLDACEHRRPSTIDHRTLIKSGPLPLAFLRGVGLPDDLIEFFQPRARSTATQAQQYYTCVSAMPAKIKLLLTGCTRIFKPKECAAGTHLSI